MECNHKQTDLLIIGAGPGGYVAAFLAADKGMKVTLVDSSSELGGVCLNRGCIPAKALLHVTEILSSIKEAEKLGMAFGEPTIDINKIREYKNSVVSRLTNGLAQLCKARKIEFIQGMAFFASEHIALISTDQGDTPIEFKKAIIATGSLPAGLPNMPLTPKIIDSTEALELHDIPSSLLIIGGGYIGLEFGSFYAKLGTQVTVAEMADSLIPGTDPDLLQVLERQLKKLFKKIHTSTKVSHITKKGNEMLVAFDNKKGSFVESFDKILVSIGRKPNSASLNLRQAKVEMDEKGFIKVNEQRQTSNPNIYAIGDVCGQPMLAHKASHEAQIVIDVLSGGNKSFHPKTIPAVIYTDPEIAYCGLTETQAKQKNLDVNITNFPWAACGRALTLNRMDGITKIIAEKASNKILGIGMVGPRAGELIAEACLAIEKEMTVSELAHIIHPHPTLSETLKECAEAAIGQCAHIFRPQTRD